MSYVRIDLTKAKEPEHVPEGEYSLRIVKVTEGETKQKKEPMTTLTIRIEDAGIPNPAPVMHYVTYPNGGQYDDMRALEIKRLLTLFDVAYDADGFDMQELQGREAKCLLVLDDSADDGVIRNKMRLPRLKE